jgi:hypothetical protein
VEGVKRATASTDAYPGQVCLKLSRAERRTWTRGQRGNAGLVVNRIVQVWLQAAKRGARCLAAAMIDGAGAIDGTPFQGRAA